MKKMTKLWALALSGLMFAACSNSDDIIPDPNVGNEGAAYVTVKLVNPSGTRANAPAEDGTVEENRINSASFFIFDGDDDTSTLLQQEDLSNTGTFKFRVNTPGNGMGFLVAVNQNVTVTIGDTYKSVKELISNARTFERYELGDDTKGNALTAPTQFPMAGWTTQDVTPGATDADGNPVTSTTTFSIEVRRLNSKVEDPKEKAGGATVNIPLNVLQSLFNDDTLTGVTFTFDGYTFFNGIDKTDAFYTWASASNWGPWVDNKVATGNKANLNSEFDTNGFYTKVYAGTADDDMFLAPGNNVMYAYENQPEDHKDAGQALNFWDRLTVYSFVIKGTLTNVDDVDDKMVRYWRANLIADDNHTVFRNTIYRLTIDQINTAGYGTPKEAEEEEVPKPGGAQVDVTVTVAQWNVKTQNTGI